MIDFRFHLISIVAVFLALALGILMGSGFLGDIVIKDLRNRIQRIGARNSEYQAAITKLRDAIEIDREIMTLVRPELTEDALVGRDVVVFEVDGVDGDVREGMETAIEEAGGRIASRITFTDKFTLPGDPERDQLGLIVGPGSAEPTELLEQTGALLGLRVAGATEDEPTGASRDEALDELLRDLEDAGFVNVEREDARETVPESSMFLVLGGHADEPAFDSATLVKSLAGRIGDLDVPVVVAETTDSAWEMVTSVREDAEVREAVTTVDQSETVPGQIAVVLGLRIEGQAGPVEAAAGHYGVRDGASALLPPFPPG